MCKSFHSSLRNFVFCQRNYLLTLSPTDFGKCHSIKFRRTMLFKCNFSVLSRLSYLFLIFCTRGLSAGTKYSNGTETEIKVWFLNSLFLKSSLKFAYCTFILINKVMNMVNSHFDYNCISF